MVGRELHSFRPRGLTHTREDHPGLSQVVSAVMEAATGGEQQRGIPVNDSAKSIIVMRMMVKAFI